MKKITVKPWEGNEAFLQFVNEYHQKHFAYHLFHGSSSDKFLLSLKEKYVDDRRHLESLILCLKSRLLEANLRSQYDDKRRALWEVWYHIHDMTQMEGRFLHEEFKPLLKEIDDAVLPYIWAEFKKMNKTK